MNLSIRIIFFLLFSAAHCSYAQSFAITGKVTDAAALSPLSKASVYINNSTRGTLTDENGFFSFTGLMPGTYEIVISYVGYATQLVTVKLVAQDYNGDFRMQLKKKELREVLILSAGIRKKYLELFRKNLLGFTRDAGKCIIKNPDAITFSPGKEKKDIKAYADEELIIENPVLGYTIYYQITDFYFNTESGASYFFGYTRFADWIAEKGVNKKWINKRKEVYAGSSQHFFKSLVNRQLTKQGFMVYGIRPGSTGNSTENNVSINTYGDNATVSNIQFSSGKQTISYNEDSLLLQTSNKEYRVYELLLHKQLMIKFHRNSDLKSQLAGVMELPGQPASGTLCALRTKREPVLVDYRGVLLTPMNVYFDGIWAYERMANMLPEDYQPE